MRLMMVGAMLGCALAAGACSSTPQAPDEPVQAGVRAVSVSAQDVSVPPIEMASISDRDNGRLIGPHYSLGVSWIARGPEIDAQDARLLNVPAVAAPQGQQLTIVSIDPTVTRAAFAPTDPVTVEALVNGRATTLPGLPLADAAPNYLAADTEVVMISAAPDASLALRVTDSGRAQQLDLRTGRATGQSYVQRDSKLDDRSTATAAARATGAGRSAVVELAPSTELTVDLNQAQEELNIGEADYEGGIGWAPPGQAFVTMAMPSVRCQTGSADWFCADYTLSYNDATAFTFTPTGGAAIAADPHDRTANLDGVPDDDTAEAIVFRVPATTNGGVISWNLAASQPRTDTGYGAMSWSVPPQPFTVSVSFNAG